MNFSTKLIEENLLYTILYMEKVALEKFKTCVGVSF